MNEKKKEKDLKGQSRIFMKLDLEQVRDLLMNKKLPEYTEEIASENLASGILGED